MINLMTEAKEIIIRKDELLAENSVLNNFPKQKKIYQAGRSQEETDALMQDKFGLTSMRIELGKFKDYEGEHFIITTSRNLVIAPLLEPVDIFDYSQKIPFQYLKKTLELQTFFKRKCRIYVADINSNAQKEVIKKDPVIFLQLNKDKKFTYLIGVWD